MKIAIVAVAYNRVNSLSRLLSSLEKASYDSESVPLIISVDKSNTDVVELFADDYKWPHGEKKVDKHEHNLGLRPHMMSLGKWFSLYDALVVLEDDIVVSPNFYYFTRQSVEKYANDSEIAGISLYSYQVNYQTGLPFQPIIDEHDAFFMNCAMSWGEVWMKHSWQQFYEWYLSHQDFPSMDHLPSRICNWNQKSWLKYHTRYCIEENKFFIYPYVSLSSNSGDPGVHNLGSTNNVYQVNLQRGCKKTFILPDFGKQAVYYDGFFENIGLYSYLGIRACDLCLDLNGTNHNKQNKRYWLTTEVKNYKVLSSFGLNSRPIETNVFQGERGAQIFLYDTQFEELNSVKQNRRVLLYNYYLGNVMFFVREYGINHFVKDCIRGSFSLFKAKFFKRK